MSTDWNHKTPQIRPNLPELEHGGLWYLVVGHWFSELVDFLQKILADLFNRLEISVGFEDMFYTFDGLFRHLDLEFFENLSDVKRWLEIFERLSFDEVDFVIEFMKLLQKLALRHRSLQNVTEKQQ